MNYVYFPYLFQKKGKDIKTLPYMKHIFINAIIGMDYFVLRFLRSQQQFC